MNNMEEFISYHKEILSLEKEFCQRKRILNIDDRRETYFGTILKTFVPAVYGGTVVTLDVRGFQEENIQRTLKLGNTIEVR